VGKENVPPFTVYLNFELELYMSKKQKKHVLMNEGKKNRSLYAPVISKMAI